MWNICRNYYIVLFSINRVAQEHEIGQSSVSKILKLNKWHPYKTWGYLKSKVYATKPQNLDDLRGTITREIELIPPETYRNAVSAVYNR
ncbi:hypothetical protein ALC57_00196 [Trachymyrmex cornetzi]|uniref:HTH psq-type domain-containing protein n=1 Tax=Trachymyrmex cornetzi TaxID=471704 RepID=A0A151JSZ0_9HYME|nr:hypothetical protein ALC57_00196 [Trachymyrmex cornetzi]